MVVEPVEASGSRQQPQAKYAYEQSGSHSLRSSHDLIEYAGRGSGLKGGRGVATP